MGHGTQPEQFTAFHYIFFSIFVGFAIYFAISSFRRGEKLYLAKGPRLPGERPLPIWLGRLAAVTIAALAIWMSFGHLLLPQLPKQHRVDVVRVGMLAFWIICGVGSLYLALSPQPLSAKEPVLPTLASRLRQRWIKLLLGTAFIAISAVWLATIVRDLVGD